jgi:WD40 repeat protein
MSIHKFLAKFSLVCALASLLSSLACAQVEQLAPAPLAKSVVIEPASVNALSVSGDAQVVQATSFAWLPGNAGLALAGPQQVAIYAVSRPGLRPQSDLSPQSAAASAPAQSPALLSVARQQPVMAWVSANTQVYAWNTQAGGTPQQLQSGNPVTGLAVDPSGSALTVATSDSLIRVQDLTTKQTLQSWKAPAWLASLSYSPDGSQVGGADLANFKVFIFDTKTGQVVRSLDWKNSDSPNLYGVSFSPDWRKLAWTARSAILLMDATRGEETHLLNHEDAVNAVSWSPDGSLLASGSLATVNGSLSPAVYIWDTTSGELLKTLLQSAAVQSLSFSPDGTQLAILDSDGKLQAWSVSR